jgi:transposase
MQASLPSLPIERRPAGPGSAFPCSGLEIPEGLPLHRQSEISARQDVDIERATNADWIGHTAGLPFPLTEAIGRHVCAGPVLHAESMPRA